MQAEKLTWKGAVEIVGIFSIVASLTFVGLQLKQDREIAAAQNIMTVLSGKQFWTELIANNASVWVKGNSGATLTAEETVVYENLASALELRYFADWYRNQRVAGANPPDRFALDFAVTVSENPGLTTFWQKHNAREESRFERLGEEEEVWRPTVNAFLDEIRQKR